MEFFFDDVYLLVQCTTVEGVQVDVSIGSSSGLTAATYMAEKVTSHKIYFVKPLHGDGAVMSVSNICEGHVCQMCVLSCVTESVPRADLFFDLLRAAKLSADVLVVLRERCLGLTLICTNSNSHLRREQWYIIDATLDYNCRYRSGLLSGH